MFPLATETSSGRRGIPGDPGHLEIRFFKLSTRHWRFLSFERDYTGSEHKFQIEAATVELDSGLIEISSEAGTEVAENLALAFSVALLHVSRRFLVRNTFILHVGSVLR